jgi:low temperature requirement protein LtrA
MSEFERSQEHMNVAFEEEAPPSAPAEPLRRRQWITRANRRRTNLDEVEIDERAFRHAHIIRRPHAMQHFHQEQRPKERKLVRSDSASSGEGEQRPTDNILTQLTRLDLFIDLIWVGIVANLSATFSEQAFTESGVSSGKAFLEYFLLFMPIWRLWDYLRDFGSNFYKDDVIQRNFMVWILILSVLYGVNAPFAYTPNEEEGSSLTLLIVIYLIARGSFLCAYALQAFFLPFLRRQVLFQIVTTTAIGGLWIAAIFVPFPGKLGLLVAANAVEHPLSVFMSSPAASRLLTGGWEYSTDVEHYIERMEGFFIIILGEGVFRLIEGSPSGMGLNAATGTVLTALLLYYCLHWLYFNADQSKAYVHALRRTWWKTFLWKS